MNNRAQDLINLVNNTFEQEKELRRKQRNKRKARRKKLNK
jgi:hypothetical protein